MVGGEVPGQGHRDVTLGRYYEAEAVAKAATVTTQHHCVALHLATFSYISFAMFFY